ncbi:LexA family transcriptional regulator [Kaistia nematophila]|uniref:LexA family transcriptional regulator n=1 Tax=Kaistia nematophila TaxID=2994654 RepID=A0A9X3IN07_9HYPH|nr:LexA family transcriptional regulator [Kaistia nematophila]MCX5571457.1 LexA family transcriptional regulator [Kaistia nematophila]
MSRLKHYREQRGLTQAALAELVKSTQPQIRRLEAGERKLTKEWATRLAAALKISAKDLLFDDDVLSGTIAPGELRRVPEGQEFEPDTDPDSHATVGWETGRQGIPAHSIAEIDVTAGLGAGGIAMISEATSPSGARFAAEVIKDFWVLPAWILARLGIKPEHAAAFPMQGDSMEPTLFAGEVGFIDLRHRIPSPPGIYAIADQFGGVMFKRLDVVSKPSDPDVMVSVISDNPRHEPKLLALEDLYVLGRYIGKFSAG